MTISGRHSQIVQAAVKTYRPIASVAALTERLVQGYSTAQGHWCTARHPDVSLRGAKRRGNLGKALPIYTECRRTQSLSNLTVAAVTAQPLAALPPYGCGVPFTGGERHWQLQIPAHSADRTGSRNCHCEEAAGRRGNLGKAVTFSPGPSCYPTVYCEIATSLRSSQ